MYAMTWPVAPGLPPQSGEDQTSATMDRSRGPIDARFADTALADLAANGTRLT